MHANQPGHQFVYQNETVCDSIDTINATTAKRNYYDYNIMDGDLYVHTFYAGDETPEDATMQITAFDLVPSNNSLNELQKFSANFR